MTDQDDFYGDPGYEELEPAAPAAHEAEGPFDTEGLLLRLREVIDTARAMPLSSSVMINRDDVAQLVEDAIAALPVELREARWLLREREEVLTKSRREAESIIDAARVRAERMVEKTEVVRQARHAAEGIMEQADADSRRMRHEAEDYVDQKLAAFEVVLDRTMQAVQRGRERLQVHVTTPALEPESTAQESAFFDQDDLA